jgi:hypothetical protein
MMGYRLSRKEAAMLVRWNCRSVLLLAILLPACGPDFSGFRDSLTIEYPTVTCSARVASAFQWSLKGFTVKDILNPDTRDQPELTAIMHVGDVRTLKVDAVAIAFSTMGEDCSGKATSVEWSAADPAVARLDITEGPRTRSLVALRPGDTVVAATLTFQDGTPPIRALPWSFTNVGSGSITVVRVVP